jgi:hypothetical protein
VYSFVNFFWNLNNEYFLFGFRIPEFFTPWSNVSSLAGATADLPCSVKNLGKFYTVGIILLSSSGLQRDVDYLG